MAKNNAESSFALVEKIATAQNFQDLLALQVHFAQEQMQAYTTQMKRFKGYSGQLSRSQNAANSLTCSARASCMAVTRRGQSAVKSALCTAISLEAQTFQLGRRPRAEFVSRVPCRRRATGAAGSSSPGNAASVIRELARSGWTGSALLEHPRKLIRDGLEEIAQHRPAFGLQEDFRRHPWRQLQVARDGLSPLASGRSSHRNIRLIGGRGRDRAKRRPRRRRVPAWCRS